MMYGDEHPINNRGIFRKLVKRSVNGDKVRYCISILTIALAVALILILCMLASGERRVEMATQEGKAQFTAMMITEEEYTEICQQPEVEWVGIRTLILRSRQEQIELQVYYKDLVQLEKEERESRLSGRLPEAHNEVVVQTEMLEALGESEKEVGDTISLNLDGNGEKEYIISGILENNRTGEGTIVVVPNLYPVLVSREYAEELYGGTLDLYCDVRLNSDSVSQTVISELASEVLERVGLNSDHVHLAAQYFTVLGSNSDENDTTWMYALIIAIFFAVLAGSVVYCVFYISVVGKVRLYGQLRTLGMTKKQVRKMVRKEAISLALRGIPLGCIIGVGIGFIINPEGFRLQDTLLWIVLSSAFILIAVFISVRKPAKIAGKTAPIEGIRYSPYTENMKEQKKLLRNLKPDHLAILNLKRNKKKTGMTIFMMAIGAILLMAISTVGESLSAYENAVFWQYPNGQFQLTISSDSMALPSGEMNEEDQQLLMLGDSVIQATNNPLSNELTSAIEEIDGVKDITVSTGFSAFVSIVNDDGSSVMSGSTNYTLTEAQFNEVKSAIITDDIDWNSFCEQNGVLVAENLQDNLLNPIHYEIGDKVDTVMLGKDGTANHIERTVMGFFATDKLMELKIVPNSPQFLMARDAALIINGMNNDVVNIQINAEEAKQEDVRAALEEIVANNENLSLQVLEDTVEQGQSDYDTISGLLTILAVLVFAFSIINFADSTITNIGARQHEIGLLQAVGMTNKQVQIMLRRETFFFIMVSLISAVLGTGIGSFICWSLEQTQHCIAYHYPILMLVAFVMTLCVCYLIISFYISRSLRKNSLIERLSVNE